MGKGRFHLYAFQKNTVVRLKKKHPCGGFHWRILRAGSDIAVQCLTCHRLATIGREQFEKMVHSICEPDET